MNNMRGKIIQKKVKGKVPQSPNKRNEGARADFSSAH